MKQTRKFCVLALALCAAILFSGCIKSDMHMSVNKNRSMDFSATYLVADYLANMSTGDDTTQNGVDENSENWKNLTERGYTLEKIEEEGYVGFKASRHYDSIDDVSKEGGVGITISNYLNEDFDDSMLFSVRRELLKDTYTAHFVYDLKGELEGSEEPVEEGSDLSAYTSAISVSYSVTLPYKANGHNASSVSEDGLTYTWKIPYGSLTAIDYSFSMPSRNVFYGIVGLAALLLLIIVIVILVVVKKHKKSAVSNEDLPAPKTPEEASASIAAAQPAEPAQPAQPAQPTQPAQPAQPTQPAQPKPTNVCPLCGGKLTIRVAQSGPNIGAKYAVCEHYPTTCKFAKPIK